MAQIIELGAPLWVGRGERSSAAKAAFARWESALAELEAANELLRDLAATEGEWRWPDGRRYFDARGLNMCERLNEAANGVLAATADEDSLTGRD